MSQKQLVYDALTQMGISFETVEHTAVFTAEEMQKLAFPAGSRIAKNLFLRDAKGKRHFLVSTELSQPVNLRALEQELGSTRLSFASEERLQKYLGLTKGSVSALGLLNDKEHQVEFYLDEQLRQAELIGFHPNDNTATVLLRFEDLLRFTQATGHEIHLIDFSAPR